MGLGNRNAKRHETVRTAGVNPADFWDFKPGQTVLTCDGFLGKVEAVHDGPLSGTEEYEVVLHNGLGGGIYRSGQLTDASAREASVENTAARDYPELAEVLSERPDPGKYPNSTLGLVAGLHSDAGLPPGMCENGHLSWGGNCPSCRNTSSDDNASVVNPGDHKPQDVENVKNASLHTATYENLSNDELGEQIRHLTGSDPVSERARHELMEEMRTRGLSMGDVVVPHPPIKQSSKDDPKNYCDECSLPYDFSRTRGTATFYHPGNGLRGGKRVEPREETVADEGDDTLMHFTCPGCGHDQSHYRDKDTERHLSAKKKHKHATCRHCYRQIFYGGLWGNYWASDHNGTDHCDAPGSTGHDPVEGSVSEAGDAGGGDAGGGSTTAVKTAGMFGSPLFDKGDLVQNHRGEGPFVVDSAIDSGHPGKSNRLMVHHVDEEPDPYGMAYYEQVFSPHPDAPPEQHAKYHQRKADNKSAEDLLSSVESADPNTAWAFEQNDRRQASSHHEIDDDEDDSDWQHSLLDDEDHSPLHDEDEGRFESTCPLCGNNRMEDGSHPYNGVGLNQECPNGRGMHERIEDRFKTLSPDRYCGEGCRSNHAADIEIGLDDPKEMRDRSEKADAEHTCRNCGSALMGSVGDQINGIGTPNEHAFLKSNPTGPTKFSALDSVYALLSEAARDADLHFQVTAAWRDVRNKAKRIRSEGNVHITEAKNGYVVAQVKGDHGTYESVLMRFPGTQKVAQWDCGCKWAKYHWGAPDDTSRFAGRMCSHALALNFEAQSRGMFGREIGTDQGVPRWLNQGDMDRVSSHEATPVQVLARHLVGTGEDPDEVALLIQVTTSVNSPFGEPTPNRITPEPGPTKPKDATENPASAGFLTTADPESWGQAYPSALDKMGALDDDALFEPVVHTAGPAIALVPELLAGGEGLLAGGEVAGAGAAMEGGMGEAAGGGLPSPARMLPHLMHPHQNGGGQQQTQQSAPSTDYSANDAYAQDSANDLARRRQNQATLHEEPEAALPSTDGVAEDPEDLFGPSTGPKTAAVPTGINYSMPDASPNTDVSASSGGVDGSGGVGPGIGLKDVEDDALSPTDPSIQSTGSITDIVAEFQATAGAQTLQAGGDQAASDIAAAATQFLTKSAMAEFSPAEQQELINERAPGGASNLDRLQIEGTHYEALEGALAQTDDDDGWMT